MRGGGREEEEEEEEEKAPCEKKKGLEVIHYLRAIRKGKEMKTEFIKITLNLRKRAMKIYLVSSVGSARS